jgi:hypothetical protein
MDDSSAFRTKDQVLFDLSKAMGFSPESLEANRSGRLSADQFKKFIPRCLNPAAIAAVAAIAPFLLWVSLTGTSEHVSFSAAVGIFVGQLMHISEMAEKLGKISTVMRVGTVLAGLGFAAYYAMRFSPGMYFDLLAREVVAREGRVIAREEQTLRPNGRDPIENYFFDSKDKRYDVNFACYKALENGSTYLMYVLPRSGVLVSMEPKIIKADAPAAPKPAAAPEPESEPEEAPPASVSI